MRIFEMKTLTTLYRTALASALLLTGCASTHRFETTAPELDRYRFVMVDDVEFAAGATNASLSATESASVAKLLRSAVVDELKTSTALTTQSGPDVLRLK